MSGGAKQGEVKMQTGKDDRSLGELFGDLAGQTGALVREEVALAKAELTRTETQAGKDIGVLVIGGAVAYAGLLALLAAAILALATVLPAWLAALIVGLVVAGVGALLLQRDRPSHGVARSTAKPAAHKA